MSFLFRSDEARLKTAIAGAKARVPEIPEDRPLYTAITCVESSVMLLTYLSEKHSCLITPFSIRVTQEDQATDEFVYATRMIAKKGFVKLLLPQVHIYLQHHFVDPTVHRFVVLPVYVDYRKWQHANMLILDTKMKRVIFFDPMNTGSIQTKDRAKTGLRPSTEVADMLQRQFIEGNAAMRAYAGKPLINLSTAMFHAQLYFESHRSESETSGYCLPLVYYITDAILSYWPTLQARFSGMDPEVLLSALVHHFVCRSHSDMSPPNEDYFSDILTQIPSSKFISGPASLQFKTECLKGSDAWTRFVCFTEMILTTYLVRKFDALNVSQSQSTKWFRMSFETYGEKKTPSEAEVRDFLAWNELMRPHFIAVFDAAVEATQDPAKREFAKQNDLARIPELKLLTI